ncbi:MAG TPA: ABC transporter substrate-binding protein, partial [Roseiflexaceae bacterium]|nr:ABC transporter substrate-binding protein [Roseiflexaceae bacterium]
MSRRFWYRAGIILLFAVQLTTAVSPITAQQAQPELIPVTLQLKWRHQFQFAGYYAAQQQGYYRAAGLDVTIVEAGLTDDPVEVVVRGDADFGISMSDLILHRARGAPVVALAAIFQHSPIVFLGLERFAIESIHDLAGKQVMVEPNSGELLAYLQAEGVPIGEISQQPHTFTTNLLLDGDIAALSAYLTDEPFVLRQAGIGYRMLSPRSSGIDFYGDTLFTTERQIRERPEVVRAFVDASLRGWNYALDNPEALIDVILTQYSRRHSRDHLRYEAAQSRRLIIPDVVEIGYMNPGRWQYIAETYADLGLMPHDVSLKGFLYQSNTGEDLSWLYLLLAGALLVLGGVTFVAARIYRLNNSIRNEIAERMRIEEHLRALERRYRVLAEHAPFPVVIIHSDSGRIMYTNAEALRTFNISREQARAMLASELYAREDESQTLIAMIAEQGRVHNR